MSLETVHVSVTIYGDPNTQPVEVIRELPIHQAADIVAQAAAFMHEVSTDPLTVQILNDRFTSFGELHEALDVADLVFSGDPAISAGGPGESAVREPKKCPVSDEIYKNVLAAMQDAEELGGPEGEHYIALMQRIAKEAMSRVDVFTSNNTQ